MATWKKIAFQEDSSNFGSSNQVQTDTHRKYLIGTNDTLSFTSEAPPVTDDDFQVPLRIEMGGNDGSVPTPYATNVYMNSSFSTNFNTTICNFTASGAFLGNTPLFSVTNTPAAGSTLDNDDTPGPEFRLTRGGSGSDNKKLGVIDFRGKNESSGTITYSRIGTEITDATGGSEDGELYINLMQDGESNQSAVLVKSRPTQAELEAGTPASPVFYTDSISLYGDSSPQFSLRRRLINEIGVTTPFEVVFFPTTTGTIPALTETWGITGGSPLFSASYSDRRYKGVRYTSAQSASVGDTFIRTVDNVGAMNISNSQYLDMGGASWICCHHSEGVTPGISNAVRIYEFNMAFFFDPSYTSSGDNLDDETQATIRIYQADTDQAGGLDQTDSSSITWKLMGKHDITSSNFADDGLTHKFFDIQFESDNTLARGYDLFILTIENTGSLDLFDADDGSSNIGVSVPFIKGEITRRVCNQLQHVVT